MDIQHVREMPTISFGEWRPRTDRVRPTPHNQVSIHPSKSYQEITNVNIDTNLHVTVAHTTCPRRETTASKHATQANRQPNVNHDRMSRCHAAPTHRETAKTTRDLVATPAAMTTQRGPIVANSPRESTLNRSEVKKGKHNVNLTNHKSRVITNTFISPVGLVKYTDSRDPLHPADQATRDSMMTQRDLTVTDSPRGSILNRSEVKKGKHNVNLTNHKSRVITNTFISPVGLVKYTDSRDPLHPADQATRDSIMTQRDLTVTDSPRGSILNRSEVKKGKLNVDLTESMRRAKTNTVKSPVGTVECTDSRDLPHSRIEMSKPTPLPATLDVVKSPVDTVKYTDSRDLPHSRMEMSKPTPLPATLDVVNKPVGTVKYTDSRDLPHSRMEMSKPTPLPATLDVVNKPETSNDRTCALISSRDRGHTQKDITTRDIPGHKNYSNDKSGFAKSHKVCTPRKTLKAKISGSNKPLDTAQLPQLENLATPVARKLHKMGNNSLFNFGFKSTNTNKQIPTPKSDDSHKVPTRNTLTTGSNKKLLFDTEKKVCNVHLTGSNCDCMNLFSEKLPSELLHWTQTDDTVVTSDENSPHWGTDITNDLLDNCDTDTTLETLKQLDTELDSEESGNKPKRVRFETDDHSEPQHDNIHIRSNVPHNKSVKGPGLLKMNLLNTPRDSKGPTAHLLTIMTHHNTHLTRLTIEIGTVSIDLNTHPVHAHGILNLKPNLFLLDRPPPKKSASSIP